MTVFTLEIYTVTSLENQLKFPVMDECIKNIWAVCRDTKGSLGTVSP